MNYLKPKIQILIGGNPTSRRIHVDWSANLRKALIENGLSPYSSPFRSVNCGGLGVCGTCRVWIREGSSFYQKRSCQIRCFHDMEIEVQSKKFEIS